MFFEVANFRQAGYFHDLRGVENCKYFFENYQILQFSMKVLEVMMKTFLSKCISAHNQIFIYVNNEFLAKTSLISILLKNCNFLQTLWKTDFEKHKISGKNS